MSNKDFLLLKQWLIGVGCVAFHLDHPFLGRPGDNQFDFLDAKLENGKGMFRFSKGLTIEVVEPMKLDITTSHLDLESIKHLRVSWQKNLIELNETSLRIES